MPRTQRAPRRRRVVQLEDSHIYHFLTGGWGESFYKGTMWGDEKTRMYAWERNRAGLVAMWSSPERAGEVVRLEGFCAPFTIPGPGFRPYFWWAQDAPEPRMVVTEGGLSKHLEEHLQDWPNRNQINRNRRRFEFGIPTYWTGLHEYETQGAYLRRLELLTEEERQALE